MIGARQWVMTSHHTQKGRDVLLALLWFHGTFPLVNWQLFEYSMLK
jgi:hypothetical protein